MQAGLSRVLVGQRRELEEVCQVPADLPRTRTDVGLLRRAFGNLINEAAEGAGDVLTIAATVDDDSRVPPGACFGVMRRP